MGRMKKYLFAVIAVVLIAAMGIVIAAQAVNHKRLVDEQYRWLRSECEQAGWFMSEYMKTNNEEQYQHAVSRVYGALIIALQIEGDEQIIDLSLELTNAYGNLITNPDEAKAALEQLGSALFSFGTGGSAEQAKEDVSAFNRAVSAMLDE